MWTRDRPQILMAFLNAIDRSRATALKMLDRLCQSREFSVRLDAFRRPKFSTAVRHATNNFLFARSINRGLWRRQLCRHGSEHRVLHKSRMLHAFEDRPAILRRAQSRLLISKPFG